MNFFQKEIALLFIILSAQVAIAQTFEAEDAALNGGAIIVSDSNASGGKYVAQKDGSLTFKVTIKEESFYNIFVHAAAPGGKKTNIFSIANGNINFTFQQSDNYESKKVVSYLKLAAGEHTVKIMKSWGWINIDYISFETVDPSNRFNVGTDLVTPDPIDHAKKLYQFLYDNYGKKVISGAMTLNSMDEIRWLKTNTGKEPALVGIDFMHSGRGYSWYNDERPVIDAKNYYSRNGIPAICWHWRDPSRKTEAFYTSDTDFDVSKISDTTSAEYEALTNDIDYISGLLKKLQNDGIPVLWRPLHEASGGWFWWGAKGAEPCKSLYILMYERMVNFHGLRNLIWVWTSQQNDLEWYPGDEYVDIIGRDIYKEGDHSSQALEFNMLNSDYGGKKMITLSECGSFPDADELVNDEVPWSYFMPWYGDFVRNSKYNSLDLWKKMFSHDYVITLDEMPDLKTYTSPPANTWRSSLYPENWKPGYQDGNGRFLHDFSYAGYHQGEKEIPWIDENIIDATKAPYSADNSGENDATSAIQKALDDVGKDGGGVVFLPAGTYKVNPGTATNTLTIRYHNTVLRGAGIDSTYILNTSSFMRQKNIIYVMKDWCTWSNKYGSETRLSTDLLFPTRIIPVQSVAGFSAGEDIILRTDGTAGFIEEHKMAGIWENWAARVMFHRTIDSIDVENKIIYIDSPTRYFMKKRDNARIYHAKKHLEECGIENLSIGNIQSIKSGWGEEDYHTNGNGAYDVHASHAIYFKYAKNCWVKNVNSFKPADNSDDFHLLSNCLLLNQCRGITVDSCFFQKPQYEGGGGNGYMFTLSSNDCLIKNSRANHSRHNYDFKMPYCNGNVIHNCTGENSKYSSDFHMYLSMSNLIDCFTVDGDYLESMFRPWGGSVIHGYSSTQSVFYNTKGLSYHTNRDYIIESRQFGHGYIIGTSGPANRVKVDPTAGKTGGYDYDTAPRDMVEGVGKGNELMPQSLYLDQLEKRQSDTIGIPKYQLVINIHHQFTQTPLENCDVQIFKSKGNTDPNGQAVFKNVNGLLIIDINKNGFYSIENKQLQIFSDTVLNFTLVPKEYQVTFVLQDEQTGVKFAGAPIVFNEQNMVSNENGEAVFFAYEGNFSFQITKNSYQNISGTVNISGDTTMVFHLIRSEAYIKFRLKEGTTPVNKATVIIDNDTLISTGLGIVNFKNLPINSSYHYKIYKGGYQDILGSLLLVKDTTVNLQMEAYPTHTNENNFTELKIWPNPVENQLFIKLGNNHPHQIEIRNLNGKLLYSKSINSISAEININNFPKGIFILHIRSIKKNIRKKFIKI